ncbi:hypothetical protein H0E84_08870 [Luteimonas sp. SJ-92]|uniref:histidine kinase n=1 Tax=Luteimonas salinisoli TaxID=2752307 RepID=A0A853JCZ7_9GAMM|nr:histidine kinase [Luteimonas salinisoli]NZA26497.1 hypothetical protein [Luteimonas salinisoli]
MSNRNDPSLSQSWRQGVELLWKHNNPEIRERERIASLLHDDFGQCLAAIGLMLDRLETGEGRQSDADIGEIRRALSQLDQSWRKAVFIPEPVHVPEEAPEMLPALIKLCRAAEREMQLRCSLQAPADPAPPTAAGGRVLLLGVSELLLNVRKHAGSPYVGVSMDSHGPWVEIAVRDHGSRPLEPSLERWRVGGFGLTNLRHELRLVGGDMRVEAAAPGRNVRLRVPTQQWVGSELGARA